MEKYSKQYQRRKTEIDAFISKGNNHVGAILNAEGLKDYGGLQSIYATESSVNTNNETGSEIVNQTTSLPVLDVSEMEEDGFEKTEELDKAIYIFKDGTLLSGFSEGGGNKRDIEHGTLEGYINDPKVDRYHPDFWSIILQEVVQIVPEAKTILFLESHEYSEAQQEKMNEYEINGYELISLESRIQKENGISQEESNNIDLLDYASESMTEVKEDKLSDYESTQSAYMSYLIGDKLQVNQQAAINRFDLLNDPVVSIEMRVDALEKLGAEFGFPVERNIDELESMISDDNKIKEFVANEHDEMKRIPEKEEIIDYTKFDSASLVYKKYLLNEPATYDERSALVKYDEESSTYDQVNMRIEAMLQVQNETGVDFSEEIKQFERTRAESLLDVSDLIEKEYFQLSKNEKVVELKETEKSDLVTYDEAFSIYVKYLKDESATVEERVEFSEFDKESADSERIALRLEAMKQVQNDYGLDFSFEIEDLERTLELSLEVEQSEHMEEESLEKIYMLLEVCALAEEEYFQPSKNEKVDEKKSKETQEYVVEYSQFLKEHPQEFINPNRNQDNTEEFVLLDKANQVGELSLKFAKENKLTPDELDRLEDMDQDVGYDRAIHARLTAVEAELFTMDQVEEDKRDFGIVGSENEESKREKLENKLETLKDNLNEISKGESSEKESYLNKEYALVFDEHFLTRSDTFELTEEAANNYLKFIVDGEITPDETTAIMENDKEIGTEASFVSRFELLNNLPRVYRCEETDKALSKLEDVRKMPEMWDVVIENEHDSMIGTYEYNQQIREGRTLEEAEKIDEHEPIIEYGQ
ncbi:MAG: hypothetical protein RR470_07635 [Vagococcus sp.]|uniref:hypothetical protein n=1 Tax=Vagococcus sp. TaxID=1933889 RepID=UPI002FC951F9